MSPVSDGQQRQLWNHKVNALISNLLFLARHEGALAPEGLNH